MPQHLALQRCVISERSLAIFREVTEKGNLELTTRRWNAAELMKEYRKLDDSVTMRMNRTLAQFRDRDRMRAASSSSNPQEESCAYFWKELSANWEKRSEIINYCVDVVGQSIQEKHDIMNSENLDSETHKSAKSASYAEEVKRNQIRNELAVEAIVRQRSLDVFKSRCRFFAPPSNESDTQKWWTP